MNQLIRHTKTLLATLATGASLLAGSAAQAADPGVAIYNDSRTAMAGGDYWTAERLAAAKPMPLKVVGDNGGIAPQRYGDAGLDYSMMPVGSAYKSAPYKSTGKLYFTIPGQGDYQCSASVIANRLVVTAAHCMYSSGVGFHSNWTFIPAYDGTAAAPNDRPLGTWNWSYGIIPSNWISTNGALPNATDFGILEFADQSFSGVVKKLASKAGKYTTATGHLFDTHVTMLGYPCNYLGCLQMLRNDSSDHRTSSNANAFEYGSDFGGGSSGGPWVENLGSPSTTTGGWRTPNTVVAVTSYIYGGTTQQILGASQFNADFTSILSSACSHQSGNC